MPRLLVARAAADLMKSQVDGYYRSDGTYVKPHDNGRQAAAPKPKPAPAASGLSHGDALRHPDHKAVVAAASRGEIDLQHAAEKHALGHDVSKHFGSHGPAVKKLFDSMSKGEVAAASRGEIDMQHEAEKAALGKPKAAPDAKPAAAPAKSAAPEVKSRNEGYGFHGEAATAHLKKKFGDEDYYSKATEKDRDEAYAAAHKRFGEVAHQLVQAGHFENHEQARDYLDSTHGRHLHDGATFHDGDVSKVSWLAKDVKDYKKRAGMLTKSMLVVRTSLLKSR